MRPYPWALIQADINGAAELDIGAFWELEGSEFRRQEVTVHGIEIFEQVRVDGAPVCKLCVYCKDIFEKYTSSITVCTGIDVDQLPVNNNRFLLRLGVGDQHVSYQ